MCRDLKDVLDLLLSAAIAGGTFILAIATWNLVGVTRSLFTETREAAKRQLGVNTWLHFINRWETNTMKAARTDLAMKFLHGRPADYKRALVQDTVLDFFEQVAGALLADCLDKNLAYSSFSYDAAKWWDILELYGYVEYLRKEKNDERIYEDFEKMIKSFRAEHPADAKANEETLKTYLRDEIELSGELREIF